MVYEGIRLSAILVLNLISPTYLSDPYCLFHGKFAIDSVEFLERHVLIESKDRASTDID